MEKINPIFSNNVVPICFSANDKYAPLLSAEIQSIIEHSSNENNYDIVILTTAFSDENHFKLLSQIKNKPNFSIRVFNVGPAVFGYNFYLDSRLTNTKYSSEIYFRLLCPTLMPDYDYVIYLDADLIVLDDLANLLKYDFSNNMIGAVRDYEGLATCYNNDFERTQYRIKELGIKTFENYFASGVLVFNVKKFNENYTEKQLLDLASSKKWLQYDQDFFNFICGDDVLIMDAKYNFVEDIDNIYHSLPEKLFKEFTKSEKDPKIIHYSGNRKPWINISSKYNMQFWKIAENTPYLENLKKMK